MFQKIVDKLLGFEMDFPKKFTVEREYNNYDLCVIHEIESPKNRRKKSKEYVVDLVIENKVKSIPYKNQLDEYFDKTKESHHLLLTVITDFEGKDEIDGWVVRSYKDLAIAIEEAVKSSYLIGYHKAIIWDYIFFVRNLNLVADGCSVNNMVSYFNPYISELCKLRINDLIEKLRTSEIVMKLKRRIKYESRSLARKEMFKQCRVGETIINYGLTHAKGLVELKVIVKEKEVALVIQVQSDHYCHAVELYDTKRNDEQNWKCVFDVESPYRWFLFPNEVDSGPSSKNGKMYNKFGNEFLYRYTKIEKDTTVEGIIEKICSDYEDIVRYIEKHQ